MDLPQGGLGIPCVVKFAANAKELHKLKLLIKVLLYVYTCKILYNKSFMYDEYNIIEHNT